MEVVLPHQRGLARSGFMRSQTSRRRTIPRLESCEPRTMLSSAPGELAADEVRTLLDRAAAASSSEDAIIAVVDRGGRILGVKVEGQVAPELVQDPALLSFAIDGAVAKARTAAFFANNEAPLTSRTINALSQSTITQRMVESNPSDVDPNSTRRGPGVVAAVGLNAHFPADVNFTPQVDLFNIEFTNRDATLHPGPDRIRGTADDIVLAFRFNAHPEFIPKEILEEGLFPPPPDSYGFVSGLAPEASPRGIATLPGGLPIVRAGVGVVGGLGVFFPGTTGFASEENSRLNDFPIPSTKLDRSVEAEFIAIAALGGVGATDDRVNVSFGELDGIPPVEGIVLPFGTITLVGITLDIYGPGGTQGIQRILEFARAHLSPGQAETGFFAPIAPIPNDVVNPSPETTPEFFFAAGRPVGEGMLVRPHDGVGGLTAEDVKTIINQGRGRASRVRAAIRLPQSRPARFVYAVTDLDGNVIGLFRDPDATIFSLDVAVAKARNAAYYADPAKLQQADRLPGVPLGTAFTARSFRYLAGPRFPQSIDGRPPGPFSVLNDGGSSLRNGVNVGPPLPASAFQSVVGYDIFNPGTNFRDTSTPVENQNGVVFFPGSLPLYKDVNGDGVPELVGGLGISGDGVDQDDIVTIAASRGFRPAPPILRADQTFVRGVRLPFVHFNRNPSLQIPKDAPGVAIGSRSRRP